MSGFGWGMIVGLAAGVLIALGALAVVVLVIRKKKQGQ